MHIPSLTILLPVYNESARIQQGISQAVYLRTQLSDFFSTIEILVVDDGSTDDSLSLICDDSIQILRRPHLGKGATVRAGLTHSQTDWVVFSDIDWSVPVDTVQQLIRYGLEHTHKMVIASREIDGSTRIAEPPWRHILGKLFNRWVQWVLLAGYMDTQCGCKLMHRTSINTVVPKLQEDGWAFDVELLLIANMNGIHVSEFPVPWIYQPQSKIRLWQDGIQMAQAVLRMKQRLNLDNFQ